MRIIDKNKDYYDFYQNIYRDNTFTFDRRDSYYLTKKEFASNFYREAFLYGYDHKPIFILLQVCNTFWLMQMFMTKIDEFHNCLDYDLKFIDSWDDYDLDRKLISLTAIAFDYVVLRVTKDFKNAIHIGNYKVTHSFNNKKLWKDNKKAYEERHIPILQDIGIPALVDGFEIYKALEKYHSAEKTASERSEAIGTTNTDKILSHGFNTKTSFRGKQ